MHPLASSSSPFTWLCPISIPPVIRSTTTLFNRCSRLYRKVRRAQARVFTPPPSTCVSISTLLPVISLVSFSGLFPWWWQIGSFWGLIEDNDNLSVCVWDLVWFLLWRLQGSWFVVIEKCFGGSWFVVVGKCIGGGKRSPPTRDLGN